MPSRKLFDAIAGKIGNHVQQRRELTQLRDWLLPLLINGHVKPSGSQHVGIRSHRNVVRLLPCAHMRNFPYSDIRYE